MVATNQTTPSPVAARSSAAQNPLMRRPTSPVHHVVESVGVLVGKALGPSKAEDVFGSNFNATIAQTSITEAFVGLVPGVGKVVCDFWHDAKLDDLDTAIKLIEKHKKIKDATGVFKFQLEAAGLHHIESMVAVGKTYLSKGDTASARQWFTTAATIYHNSFAYLHLYMMCKDNEPDYALALLKKAKEHACLEYFLELEDGYTYKERFETTLFVAALGDIDSMIIIGKTFYEVEKDTTSALQWLNKAASEGSPEAQYEIFKLLENNDADKAFYALNWAAEAGHQQAIGQLVDIYENTGFGEVRPNPNLANTWKQKLNGLESKQYSTITTNDSLYIMPVYDPVTRSFPASQDT